VRRSRRAERIERRVAAVDRDFAERAAQLLEKHGAETLWGVPRAEVWRWQERRAAAYRIAHGRDPKTAELLQETRKAMRLEAERDPNRRSSSKGSRNYIGVILAS
jgi:hypothetical protein